MKLLSYNELELFYHFRTFNENLLNSCRTTSSQLSKMSLRVLTTFTGKLFSRKLWIFFWSFCILIASASFLAEFFSAGFLKLHSTCQKTFSRKNFGRRISFSILQTFLNLIEKLSYLWGQLFGSIVKIALLPPAEQIEGKFVLKKCINP